MDTYDYQNEIGFINEMETKIDTLSEGEAKEVSEFIDTLKKKTVQEQTTHSLEWIKVAILPILQEYAKKTCSLLIIEEAHESVIMATLKNDIGYDVTENSGFIKMLFNLANYVGIESEDEKTCIILVFDSANLVL